MLMQRGPRTAATDELGDVRRMENLGSEKSSLSRVEASTSRRPKGT